MTGSFTVDLAGKTAVVTGGSGVLGGCMCQALAGCGARVAVAGHRPGSAESVVERIKSDGGSAMAIECDVLDRGSLEEASRLVEKELGQVDILVNAAGGNYGKGTTSTARLSLPDPLQGGAGEGLKTFYDLDPQGMEFVFNLNFMGTVLATQVFTRGMAERQSGTVVNISSMAAFTPLTKVLAYSAAKAAVSNFTQWLAVHMSQVGVRVNAIAPGFFLTEQNRSLLTDDDGSLTARSEDIISHTPLGRFGNAEDLTGTLLWLVSDEAAGFVTGTVIPVDGGFSAFGGV